MSTKVFMLNGLDCANCAAKIETEIKNIEGIKFASVDFVSKRLTWEAESNTNVPMLVEKIESIVKKIEPDVKIALVENTSKPKIEEKDDDDDDDEEDHKKEIVELVIGGTLFVVGLIFKFQNWLELTIFLISYIIVGRKVVLSAIKGIVRGQVFSEHFLMSVATIGAFFVGEYPEGVAVMLFYLVGELFEDMAVDNSRKSISELMDIRPDYANLRVGEELKKVSPDEVNIGNKIVVKPGEKIPLDGKVIEGTSMVSWVGVVEWHNSLDKS